MEPKGILKQTRELINEHAAGDPDKWWYANRFVFARLHVDERKTKTSIKQGLLEAGVSCHGCGATFDSKRNIHLHRVDGSKGYIEGNCVLMHAECHQKYHSGPEQEETAGTGRSPSPTKKSKRYDDMPFIYWWDIAPGMAESLDGLEAIEFVKKDTEECCIVPAEAIKPFVTPDRQTTRGQGNWGVKVMKNHPDELAFEPSTSSGDWLFLPVTWISHRIED